MNITYLWAVPVVLVLALAGWLALRRRAHRPQRAPVQAGPAGQPAADAGAEAALRASIQAAIQLPGDAPGRAPNAAAGTSKVASNASNAGNDSPNHAVNHAVSAAANAAANANANANANASVLAQRQAATEALRQARRRMADEAVRLEAERLARQAAPPPAAPQRVPRPAGPAAAPDAAQRPQAAHRPAVAPGTAPAPLSAAAPVAARAAVPAASPARRPPEPAGPAAPLLGPQSIQLAGSRAPGQPLAPAGLAPLRPAGPPTVLVADDSKVVRVKTGRLLEKQGWRVLLAEDGQAALQWLQSESPDLLVTDVEMPGLDGFELTRRLRASARWARLPVIMVTSSDDKHRDEAFAIGVNVLLGKPYADEALLAHAKQLLPSALRRAEAGTALH